MTSFNHAVNQEICPITIPSCLFQTLGLCCSHSRPKHLARLFISLLLCKTDVCVCARESDKSWLHGLSQRNISLSLASLQTAVRLHFSLSGSVAHSPSSTSLGPSVSGKRKQARNQGRSTLFIYSPLELEVGVGFKTHQDTFIISAAKWWLRIHVWFAAKVNFPPWHSPLNTPVTLYIHFSWFYFSHSTFLTNFLLIKLLGFTNSGRHEEIWTYLWATVYFSICKALDWHNCFVIAQSSSISSNSLNFSPNYCSTPSRNIFDPSMLLQVFIKPN